MRKTQSVSMEKKEIIKKCEVCGKELTIKKQKIGSNKGTSGGSSLSYSDDGVFFEDGGVWFCNSCNSEIHDNIKIDYRKFL